MNGAYSIAKGYDINLEGQPSLDVVDIPDSSLVAVYPLEYSGLKQRLKVREGDRVKRGSELIENKNNENFKICAPASGTVKSIVRGARRFVEKIVIETDAENSAESFGKVPADKITGLSRDVVLDQLVRTGYLAYIRQRPFGGIADVSSHPKSIFINAMNTAPFLADAGVIARDDQEGLQAGVNLMTVLTEGDVHMCVGADADDILGKVENAKIQRFKGKHPAGNTSVHISRVAPMDITDIIWTVRAVDLVQIGRLFLDGVLPAKRIISLGGPGVKSDKCRHYRVRVGGDLSGLLSDAVNQGEQRIINGDVLSGTVMEKGCHLRLQQSSITVVPEGRTRRFLGWLEPGFNRMSFTRLCASTFMGSRKWSLDSHTNGGVRAMVLTGYYDKVMPMNIMVDYLVRAVLAGDTDEAISLGILETVPEDFALCEFICPCKIEIQDIVARGLAMIEEEGI